MRDFIVTRSQDGLHVVKACQEAYPQLKSADLFHALKRRDIRIDGKKINRKKNIKYKVVAFKTENGKKVQLGESLTLCAAGTKSKEYTNVSEVTLNKTKKTLEKGKTFKIKADLKLEDESKKLIDPGIKYESSDTSVAKVSSKGKITTVGKGTCYVYVRSATGAYAKIKITVK